LPLEPFGLRQTTALKSEDRHGTRSPERVVAKARPAQAKKLPSRPPPKARWHLFSEGALSPQNLFARGASAESHVEKIPRSPSELLAIGFENKIARRSAGIQNLFT